MKNRFIRKATSWLTMSAMLFSMVTPAFLSADGSEQNTKNPYLDEGSFYEFNDEYNGVGIFLTANKVIDEDTLLEELSQDEFLAITDNIDGATVDYYTGSIAADDYFDDNADCETVSCLNIPDSDYPQVADESRTNYDAQNENPSIPSDQSGNSSSASGSYDTPPTPNVTVEPDYVKPPEGNPPSDADVAAYEKALEAAQEKADREERRIEAEMQAEIDAKIEKVTDLSAELSGLKTANAGLASSINSKNNTADSKSRSLSSALSSLRSVESTRAGKISDLNDSIEIRNTNAQYAHDAAQIASDTTIEANRLEAHREVKETTLASVEHQVILAENQVNDKLEQIPDIYANISQSVVETSGTVQLLYSDLDESIQVNNSIGEAIYDNTGIKQALYDLNLTYQELEQLIIEYPQEPTIPVLPSGETLKTDPSHPKYDDLVSAIQYYQSLDDHVQTSPYEEVREIRGLARIAIELADNAYSSGNNHQGDAALEGALSTLDLALDFVPGVSFVKDIVTLTTGVNPVTGEEASGLERSLIAGGLLLPTFITGSVKVIRKIAKSAEEIAEHSDEASDAAEELLDVFRQSDEELADITDASCTKTGPIRCELGEFTDEFLDTVPAGLSPKRFKELVDSFASLPNARAVKSWKTQLRNEGLSEEQIVESIYRGSLKRGTNIWGSNWGRYYEEISGTIHPGAPYHAHHLVQKGTEIAIIVRNRKILTDVGINPDLARENFTWALQTAADMHGTGPQTELNALLEAAAGDRQAILGVLDFWAKRCEDLG